MTKAPPERGFFISASFQAEALPGDDVRRPDAVGWFGCPGPAQEGVFGSATRGAGNPRPAGLFPTLFVRYAGGTASPSSMRWSAARARPTRLLTVPTMQPQISAVST